jgi:hypothetical protein
MIKREDIDESLKNLKVSQFVEGNASGEGKEGQDELVERFYFNKGL